MILSPKSALQNHPTPPLITASFPGTLCDVLELSFHQLKETFSFFSFFTVERIFNPVLSHYRELSGVGNTQPCAAFTLAWVEHSSLGQLSASELSSVGQWPPHPFQLLIHSQGSSCFSKQSIKELGSPFLDHRVLWGCHHRLLFFHCHTQTEWGWLLSPRLVATVMDSQSPQSLPCLTSVVPVAQSNNALSTASFFCRQSKEWPHLLALCF